MQRAPCLWLPVLATVSSLALACASASVPSHASRRPAPGSGVEPALHGPYVVTAMSQGTGALAASFDIARSHGATGSRLALDFDDDAVEVELLLVDVVALVQSDPSAGALVVVSRCAASASAVWNRQGFALTDDQQALRGASATVMSLGPNEPGGAQVHLLGGAACTVSLDPDEFVIAERGPHGADGRPSTVLLRYGARQESVVQLTAAVPSSSLDPVELAAATAEGERRPGPAGADTPAPEPTVLRILVPADGSLHLQIVRNHVQVLASTPVTHDSLREHARATHVDDPRTRAVLSVDMTVPYGSVMAVVDALRIGGVTRVALSLLDREPGGTLHP